MSYKPLLMKRIDSVFPSPLEAATAAACRVYFTFFVLSFSLLISSVSCPPFSGTLVQDGGLPKSH